MFYSAELFVPFKISPFFSNSKSLILLKRLILVIVIFYFAAMGNTIFAQIESHITSSDGAADDRFGQDMSLFGDYLVVGAAYDDNEKGIDAGSVYVFRRNGNRWIQQAKLIASDGAAEDLFGYAVDISEDYIVVGACWDDDDGEKSGSTYVYKLEGGIWIEQAKLTASDSEVDDRFGIDAEISGEYILVGAFFDDDLGSRSGSAYMFKRDGTVWTQQAKLTASDGAADDWFGVNLSLHGDDAAIAARYDDDLGSNSGSVYIFHRAGTEWIEQAKLTASDGAAGDQFSVPCIFGNTVVVGAYLDDDSGVDAGLIYYFQREGGVWTERARYTASDGRGGDYFGCSLSLTPTLLVVGAYRDNDERDNSGSFYIFKREGYAYFEEAKITASGGAAGDFFGLPVSISGDYITAAARNDDTNGDNAGAVYVYHLQEEPQIISINDVPHDQGGVVTVKWSASYFDIGRNFSYYSIWRAVDEKSLPGLLGMSGDENQSGANNTVYRCASLNGTEYTWEWLANCPGHRFNDYSYSAATLYDSMSTPNGKHYFMVSAHLEDANIFYDSNIDSGYSVDNLAPAPPMGLQAFVQANSVKLIWEESQEPDFAFYVVYRDHAILDSIRQNTFTDSNVEAKTTYSYQLQALDVHENASDLSREVSVMTTDVLITGSDLPKQYSLSSNYPNPFNPDTEIRFAIPKTSQVVLKIFNTLGHEIATLVNAQHIAGNYTVQWDGKDRFGNSGSSGIYIYTIQAGEFKDQKKMTLIR